MSVAPLNQQAQIMHAFRRTRDYLASAIQDKSTRAASHLAKASLRKAQHHLCLWLDDFCVRGASEWWPMNTYSFKQTVDMILEILRTPEVQDQASGVEYCARLIEAAMRGTLQLPPYEDGIEYGMEGEQGVPIGIVMMVEDTIHSNTPFAEYVQGLLEDQSTDVDTLRKEAQPMTESLSNQPIPVGEHQQRRTDWTHLKEVLRDPIELEAMRRFYQAWTLTWHRGYNLGWTQRAVIPMAPERASWNGIQQMITTKAQSVTLSTKFDEPTVDQLLMISEVIGNLINHAAEQDENMMNHILQWQESRDNGPVGSAEVPE